MRITVKCARSYLHKVNLRDIKLLKAVDQQDGSDPQDFLSEVIRTIGAQISDSDTVGPSTATADKEDEADMGLDDLQFDEPTASAPKSDKEHYVYTNLNCPLQEDYTFIVTTLWHWYTANPPADLKVIKDPAEITVEVPPEESPLPAEALARLEGEEAKAEGEKPAAEEGKKDAEEEKKPDEPAAAEEEKKPDEVAAEDAKEAE